MKLYLILLSILCYSQLSFPMLVPHVVSVKQTKKIVDMQVPKKRTISNCTGCTCISDIKKENIKKTEKRELTIAIRNRLVKDAQELIKNKKEEWQQQGVFPEKEGLALENALSSYCPHFENCARRVRNKKFRAQMGFTVAILPCLDIAVNHLGWITDFYLFKFPFYCTSQYMFFWLGTTFYSSLSLYRARTYEKILAQKAEEDRDSLEPLFRAFVKAYAINLFYSKMCKMQECKEQEIDASNSNKKQKESQ